jgi:hypothetical protein
MSINMNYVDQGADNQKKNLARLRDLVAMSENKVCAECPEPSKRASISTSAAWCRLRIS